MVFDKYLRIYFYSTYGHNGKMCNLFSLNENVTACECFCAQTNSGNNNKVLNVRYTAVYTFCVCRDMIINQYRTRIKLFLINFSMPLKHEHVLSVHN